MLEKPLNQLEDETKVLFLRSGETGGGAHGKRPPAACRRLTPPPLALSPPGPVCCSGSLRWPFDAVPWPGVKSVLAALCLSSKERRTSTDGPLGLMRSPDTLAGENLSRPAQKALQALLQGDATVLLRCRTNRTLAGIQFVA